MQVKNLFFGTHLHRIIEGLRARNARICALDYAVG